MLGLTVRHISLLMVLPPVSVHLNALGLSHTHSGLTLTYKTPVAVVKLFKLTE